MVRVLNRSLCRASLLFFIMKTKTKTRYKLDLKITDQEGKETLIEHHYETWMLDEIASTLRGAEIRLLKLND